LIPAGLLLTVPVPVPASVTVSVKLLPVAKVVVTAKAAVPIVAVHVGGFVCGFAGTQFALKLVNVELPVGVAVSTTWLPLVKLAAQVVGQLIPAGLLITVPVPVPASVTVSVVPLVEACWHSNVPIAGTPLFSKIPSTLHAEAT
jgi:hypothetical protein